MKKPAVIFLDFGGTLFDYCPSNEEIWAKTASLHGRPTEHDDPDLIRALVNKADAYDRLTISSLENGRIKASREQLYWLENLVAEELGIWDAAAVEHALESFEARLGSYSVFPDALLTLEMLKQSGIRIGLISNVNEKTGPMRRPLLKQEGLLDYFETIILSTEVGYRKPDVQIFQHALDSMKLSDPADAWYVGDLYGKDVIGSRNAGLIPVLFDRTGHRKVDCIRIQALSALVELVDTC